MDFTILSGKKVRFIVIPAQSESMVTEIGERLTIVLPNESFLVSELCLSNNQRLTFIAWGTDTEAETDYDYVVHGVVFAVCRVSVYDMDELNFQYQELVGAFVAERTGGKVLRHGEEPVVKSRTIQ